MMWTEIEVDLLTDEDAWYTPAKFSMLTVKGLYAPQQMAAWR
jgi:hypothetical protein